MNKYFLATSALAAFLLVGCGNDPYPKGAIDNLTDSKPTQEQIFPALTLQYSPVMEFQEGVRSEYSVTANAPTGSTLSVLGLPGTASFDPATGKISWQPTFTDADSTDNPLAPSKSYPITLRLISGTGSSISVVQQSAVLLVQNVLRPLLLFTQPNHVLREGVEYVQDVILSSQELTEGQPTLFSQTLPFGSRIEPVPNNPTKFRIRFTPPVDFVNASDPADAQGNFRQFQIQLLGVSARGQTIQTNVTWTVRDSRLNPIISAPANLAGFANLSFSVAARNPNRDGAPVIRLLTQPNIGRVNLQTVTTPSSESLSIVNVNWTDQPFDQLGTTHAFVFQVCLASNTAPLCQNHRIDVLLQGELREAPAFDRAAFALGEVKAIKVGEQVNINLPIRDLDNQQPITSATIELSSSTLAEVAWVNGRLAIKGLAPGLLQFNVVARSAYGLTKKESFLVQVSEPTP